MTLDDFKVFSFIVMDLKQAGSDDVESNAPALVEGTVPLDSSEMPVTVSQGGRARKSFFQAMNEWFAEFVRTNPAVRPPPPHDFQSPHVAPLVTGTCTVIRERPPVDKIRKQGLKSFGLLKMMMQREQNFGLRILSEYLMSYPVHLRNVEVCCLIP